MKKLILLAALAVFALPSLAKAEETHLYTEITSEQLVQMKKDVPGLVIIDSREGEYYDKTLIEGAIHLGASETNEANLAKVVPAKETPVAFYCVNTQCPASAEAAKQASAAGYTKLYKLPGGIDEWKEKGLPTVQEAATEQPVAN